MHQQVLIRKAAPVGVKSRKSEQMTIQVVEENMRFSMELEPSGACMKAQVAWKKHG